MKKQYLSLALIALLLFSACAPTPELRNDNFLKDVSLLSGDPCEAPCWNDIVPGETAWRDAVRIVQRDERFVEVQEQNAEEETSDAVFLTWKDGDAGQQCCVIQSRDGEVVDAIVLFVAPEMKLGELLEKYGDPLYLDGSTFSDDQAYIALVYPEKSVSVTIFVAGESGALSASSEIISVLYVSPENMKTIISTTPLYRWDGYNSYKYYIDGNYDLNAENVDGTDSEASLSGEATSESTPEATAESD